MVSSIEEFRRMKEQSAKVERDGQKRAKTASLISLIGGAASAFGGKQSFQAGISGGQQLQQQVQEETDTQQQQMERDFMMKMQAQQFDQQFKMNDQKMKRDDMDFKRKMEEQKRQDERAAASRDATESKAEGVTEQKPAEGSRGKLGAAIEFETPKYTPKEIEQIGAITESLSRGEISAQQASMDLARIGAELPKSESQEMAEAMKARENFMDFRKKELELQGMEVDNEADIAFYGILDGTTDIRTLSRPVRAQVRGMLEDYMQELQDDQMSMAKDKASITASYASAGAANELANSRKLEQVKTMKEIDKMDQEPQQRLTYDEIKGMAMNVREDYYYDPVRKLATVGDNAGIISILREMKDEGMAPEDMTKFLKDFAPDMQTKSYSEFSSEVQKKSRNRSKVSEEKVNAYIKESGWKRTEGGGYVFSTSFSKEMNDPDVIQALLEEVYSSDKAPLSNEQYTGEMWEPMR